MKEQKKKKTHDGLINANIILEAQETLCEKGATMLFEELLEIEPELGQALADRATSVAGKLALTGAPHSLICGCYSDLLEIVVLCFHAVRIANARLWQDVEIGNGWVPHPEKNEQSQGDQPQDKDKPYPFEPKQEG